MTEIIPLAQPDIGPAEHQAVRKVLDCGQLSIGEVVPMLEAEWAQIAQRKQAVAVNSGTTALELVVKQMVPVGKTVITTPFSFISSAACVIQSGARLQFVDIDEQSFNLDPEAVKAAWQPEVSALLSVDVFGWPCDYQSLLPWAKEHQLTVIADAAEGAGGHYQGKALGAFGDVAVMAMTGNKQLTAAEGGVILTDDEKMAETFRALRNLGRASKGAWLEHPCLGHNFRMSEVHAAIGLAQLKRREGIVNTRWQIADRYNQMFKDLDGVQPLTWNDGQSKRAPFLYVLRLDASIDRDRVIDVLREQGIESRDYFRPLHLQPVIQKHLADDQQHFPVCEAVAQSTLALPFFNTISERQQHQVVEGLKKAL